MYINSTAVIYPKIKYLIHTSSVARIWYVNKIKKYVVDYYRELEQLYSSLIIININPLNPKLHILLIICMSSSV